MGENLLALVRDAIAPLAPLLGTQALTTVLVLVGATALATVALAFVARATTAASLGVAPVPAHRTRRDVDVRPFVSQSDPHAPGRPRPRAPGAVLG